MVLIQPGKPGTEQSGSEHEPKAPQPINIQGQGKCQSQQKIFAKMCHLPYEKMNLIYIHSHLRGIQIAGGQLSQQEHHLFTDQYSAVRIRPPSGRKRKRSYTSRTAPVQRIRALIKNETSSLWSTRNISCSLHSADHRQLTVSFREPLLRAYRLSFLCLPFVRLI